MRNEDIEKMKIPYNMSNEEYLAMLQYQNKIKKESNITKEKGSSKTKQLEKNFNVYLSGANQERVTNQLQKQRGRGMSNPQEEKVKAATKRKSWQNPHPQVVAPKVAQSSEKANYKNPFEISGGEKFIQTPQIPQIRKKWNIEGATAGTEDRKPTKVKVDHNINIPEYWSELNNPVLQEGYSKRQLEDEVEEEIGSDSNEEDDDNTEKDKPMKIKDLESNPNTRNPHHEENEEEDNSIKQFLGKMGKIDINHLLKETLNLQDMIENGSLNLDPKLMQNSDGENDEIEESIYDKSVTEEQIERNINTNVQIPNKTTPLKDIASMESDSKIFSPKVIHHPIKVLSKTFYPTKSQPKFRPMDNEKVRESVISAIQAENESINISTTNTKKTEYEVPVSATPAAKKLNKFALNPFQRPQSQQLSGRSNFSAQQMTSESRKGTQVSGQSQNPIQTQPQLFQPRKKEKKEEEPKEKEKDLEKELKVKEKPKQVVGDPFMENGLKLVVNRIKKFDKDKLQHLLEVLEKIDEGVLETTALDPKLFSPNAPSSKPSPKKMEKQQHISKIKSKNTSVMNPNPKTEKKELHPVKKKKKEKETLIPKTHQEVLIRILNTWGHNYLAGLTEIQLYDISGYKIEIPKAGINARKLGGGPHGYLHKLINSMMYTNDEKQMWVGNMPIPPQCLEIVISIPKTVELGGIIIWNYNKSNMESTKGVKSCEILVDGEHFWNGTVRRANGRTDQEYGTSITKNSKFVFKNRPSPSQPLVIGAKTYSNDDPQNSNQSQNQNEGLKMPAHLENLKKEIEESTSRPVSVPIWLQDTENFKKRPYEESKKQFTKEVGVKEPDKYSQFPRIERDRADDRFGNKNAAIVGANKEKEEEKKNGEGSYFPDINSSNEVSTETSFQGRVHEPSKDTKLPPAANNDFMKRNYSMPKGVKAGKAVGESFKPRDRPSRPKDDFKPMFERGGVSKKTDMYNEGEREEKPATEISKLNERRYKKSQERQQQMENKSNEPSELPPAINPINPVDDSLESIDFFRITNLGRIHAANRFAIHEDTKEPLPKMQNEDNPENANGLPTISAIQGKMEYIAEVNQKELEEIKEVSNILNKGPQPSKNVARQPESQNWKAQPKKNEFEFRGDALETLMNKFNSKEEENEEIAFHKKVIEEYKASNEFIIPSYPSGSNLKINIITTWGDIFYLGLSGIELFDGKGNPIKLQKNQIKADPPDINILPEYGNDPRTIDKLVDGTYFTKDDLHVWLCPFTSGKLHTIFIDLKERVSLSMIRIWNYNKSRIHTSRGAKDMIILMDQECIFKGQIKRSNGLLSNMTECCEIILFSQDANVLQRIQTSDWVNTYISQDSTSEVMLSSHLERPGTASRMSPDFSQDNYYKQPPSQSPSERPLTSAIIPQFKNKLSIKEQLALKDKELADIDRKQKAKQMAKEIAIAKMNSPEVMEIELNIIESWSDPYYVGLTGIALLDEFQKEIPLTMENLKAEPQDMNTAIPGHKGDSRTLDKLIDGVNQTVSQDHMWLIPFTPSQPHYIWIKFTKKTKVSAIRIWNYNKNEDDINRGAKTVLISIDRKLITSKKGITFRIAPGLAEFDFCQEIKLPINIGWDQNEIIPLKKQLLPKELCLQEYDAPYLPTGLLLQICLVSTYGDIFYLGLNGIEIYDQLGRLITSPNSNIKCKLFDVPSSAQVLENDLRTVDKLIDHVNNTKDDHHMWLNAFYNTKVNAMKNKGSQPRCNAIWVLFDRPVSISYIKIWNYSKTPARGVKEMLMCLDNQIIYRGYLKIFNANNRDADPSTAILFTSDKKAVGDSHKLVHFDRSKRQQVKLFNDRKPMNFLSQMESEPKDLVMERPATSVVGIFK